MTTKKYNLLNLIASTTDVEILHPTTGEPTGITVTMLPADSPKIKPFIAQCLGSMPDLPESPKTAKDFAESMTYQIADEQLNRDIVNMRVIGSNDDGLKTPEQRKTFFDACAIEVIEQLQRDGGDRTLYFR